MTPQDTQPVRSPGAVNQEMREFWTGEGLQHWQQNARRWDRICDPFGQAMLDAARLRPGERVLDIGCGHGATTLEAAERVAPSGYVLGLDISEGMLDAARQRVAAAGLGSVEMLAADAQTHPFEAGLFDVAISRFALMLFDDPVAAFANLACALRPGGRLLGVCWQDPRRIEWIAAAVGVAVATLARQPDLGPPGAPGPFAFADGERVTRLLEAGGFRDVTLETVTRPQRVGEDLDDAVAFILSLPETHALTADAPQAAVAGLPDALRKAFAPYAGPHGVVMGGSAWLVSARRCPSGAAWVRAHG